MAITLAQQLTRKKPLATADPGGHQGGHDGSRARPHARHLPLMMFGVGATVGTGIFFVLPESVPDAGPAVIVAFLLAGLAAGLSAICYAEMASAIPVSGSTYSYAYHSLGELVAMVIAACVILEYGVAAGAVAVGWSGYFNELLDKTIGVSLPDALSYSPIPVDDGTTGLINLPAVVLVVPVHDPAHPRSQRVGQGQHDHGDRQAERPRALRRHRPDGVPGRPLRLVLGGWAPRASPPRPARSSSRSSASMPCRRPVRRSRTHNAPCPAPSWGRWSSSCRSTCWSRSPESARSRSRSSPATSSRTPACR